MKIVKQQDKIRLLQNRLLDCSEELLNISEQLESFEMDIQSDFNGLNKDHVIIVQSMRNMSQQILDYERNVLKKYKEIVDLFGTTGMLMP